MKAVKEHNISTTRLASLATTAGLATYLDISLLVIITKINVLGTADGLQVLGGKLLKSIVIPSPLVILQISGISPLDGRVAANTVGITEGLSLGGTVDVGDELSGTAGKFLC